MMNRSGRKKGDSEAGRTPRGGSFSRRNPTAQNDEMVAGPPGLGDKMAEGVDESLEMPAPSLASIPTRSSSWDNSFSEGEGYSGRRSRAERRKLDTTTPTLIDEEDESDEEMLSLEQERVRLGMTNKDESSVSLTPGGGMYSSMAEQTTASLRRTPGASAMHRSQQPVSSAISTEDSAIFKFGLNLSTPMEKSGRLIDKESPLEPVKSMDSYSSSASSDNLGAQVEHTEYSQASRPPRAPPSATRPQEQRENLSYTPAGWTLSKNPHLEVSHGAFSPHTLRLTEDIDNLLLDEDDNTNQTLLARQQVFRNQLKSVLSVQSPIQPAGEEPEGDTQDSWMASYIFDQDGGSATSAKPTRSSQARGRRSSGRRSRTSDAAKEASGPLLQGQTPQQKPKPVRRTSVESKFSVSSFATQDGTVLTDTSREDMNRTGSRSFNFGGAFEPTARRDNTGSFRPFVPASERGPSQDTSFGSEATMLSEPRSISGSGNQNFNRDRDGLFQPSTQRPQAQSQNPYQYGGFQQAAPVPQSSTQPLFMHHSQGEQMAPHHSSSGMGFHGHAQAGGYDNQMFNNGPPNNNIPMGFQPPMGAYQMDQARMSNPVGQPFMPMHHQQNPQHGFVPPGWSNMPQYAADSRQREAGWQPRNDGWGPVNEFGYGPGIMDPRMQMTPSPQFGNWQESDMSGPDFNHFHQHSHMPSQGPPGHHMFPAVSVSPIPPVMHLPPHSNRPYGTDDNREALDRKQGKKGFREKKSSEQGKAGRKKSEGKSTSDKGKKKKTAPAQGKKTGASEKKKQSGEAALSKPKGKHTAGNQESKSEKDKTGKTTTQADAKRAELMESPATRSAFKDFYREFRAKERSSFQEAEDFAFQTMKDGTIPEQIYWRVYLELADLAKRSNKFDNARQLYRKVCQLQPYASQGWLEYSKLEEECGHLNRCSKILHSGLSYCDLSENLLTRAIKHEEKMGNIVLARQLLARLKHAGIEKVWRTVLEGALMEARVGNSLMARKVLKVLMHHVPWYGPLYLEAYRLERDLGRHLDALAIVERGLASIPRYGPLWFGAFRLCEALDVKEGAVSLPRTKAMFERAIANISRELLWKVHLEAAQIFERNAGRIAASADSTTSPDDDLLLCRHRFAKTVVCCPANLSWKVWLASGRMELSFGNADKARMLFLRAMRVVPEKGKVAALLECARLEEFIGKPTLARALLSKGRHEVGSDWKIWLESVLLEVRSGHHFRAIDLAKHALETHNGTGRLWAALIQLRYYDGGEDAQNSALKRALMAVPKSGEVWCEGGRIHMNPFSRTFDLAVARRHLFFATRFTPQYGDSFLEALKLDLLEQWIAPVAFNLWKGMERSYAENIIASRDDDSLIDQVLTDIVRRTFRLVRLALGKAQQGRTFQGIESEANIISPLRNGLSHTFCEKIVDNSELELRCANADPNYGPLWFHCREGRLDTARTVIASAREIFVEDLIAHADVYVAAIVRRFALIVALKHQEQTARFGKGGCHETDATDTTADVEALDGWEALLEARLRSAPSLEKMIDQEAAVGKSGTDFLTGLVEMNKPRPLEAFSLVQRRKAIFGSDALFS